ncbi:hypothetical protein BJY52DRAFT_1228141 [Lactarius psammicola]|nr:hypothetical protein BJY52DRAFT_1228141 [Lactarius psammicola]
MTESEPLTNIKSWQQGLLRKIRPGPRFGVGIELRTRKRSGTVTELTAAGENCVRLGLRVNQALRHYPKYTTIRDLVPHAHAQPSVIYSELDVRGPLPDDVTTFVRDAGTVFLGASFLPDTDICWLRH